MGVVYLVRSPDARAIFASKSDMFEDFPSAGMADNVCRKIDVDLNTARASALQAFLYGGYFSRRHD